MHARLRLPVKLVLERLFPPDGLTACTVALGAAALDHEPFDAPVYQRNEAMHVYD